MRENYSYNEMTATMEKVDKKRLALVIVPVMIIIAALAMMFYNASFTRILAQSGSPLSAAASHTAVEKSSVVVSEKEVVLPEFARMIIVAPDSAEAEVTFENPEATADSYYLAFELVVNDSVLCSTGLLEAGESVTFNELSETFAAGEYEAVLRVKPYCAGNGTACECEELPVTLIAM